METTRISTKGQVVIPEGVRKGIEVGDSFIVSRKDNLIILKRIEGLTKKEEEEMEELNKIWKEIDGGKCESYEEENFFEKMKSW
jgi:AbrB family looped-hinge helix DNA binding protein